MSLKEGLRAIFGTVSVYGQEMVDVDGFVDAAGAAPLFQEVIQLAKQNARYAVIAVYKNEVPLSLTDVMSKEIQIIGASGYTSDDILRVVEHINDKKTPIATMITHVYKLDDIQQAFDQAIAAKDTIKVLVDLTDD